MKVFQTALGLAVSLAFLPAVHADEVKSGVPVGGRISSYSTTKVCGVKDGVKVGQSLCYT